MLNSFFLFITIISFNFFIFHFYKPVAKIYNLYDNPDYKRKIHKKKIPLLGGLYLSLNLLLIILLNFIYPEILDSIYFDNIKKFYSFFFISISFYFLGFFDDKIKLNPSFKLIIMIIILSFAIFLDEDLLLKNLNSTYFNYSMNLSYYSYLFTVLCFLLFINAFNMLDGINGQVATYFLFILLLFLSKGLFTYLLIFGAYVLFFLKLNFKNKIFLGDSGSLPLAFIVGYLFIKSYNLDNKFSIEEIFLVMSVPGYELLRLAISRILNRKHPFEADNQHIHHLILAKKNLLSTFLIIQFLLIFPYILLYLTNSFLFSFLINLFLYIIIIIYFKKFNYKIN